MDITVYYPNRQSLSKLSKVEKYILEVISPFYNEKTPVTEYVKQKSLPLTLYFNCICTMYKRLYEDPAPTTLVNKLWEELTIKRSQYPDEYHEDSGRQKELYNYYPNREYERVLLFGGLIAKVKAEPFCNSNLAHIQLVDALVQTANYNETALQYLQPFIDLDIQEEVRQEKLEEQQEMETTFYLEEFMKAVRGLENEEAYPLYVSELQRVRTDGTYPKRYESFLETWINAMAKARTRDFKPADNKVAVATELPDGTFTIDELAEVILENYKDDHKLVDKLETSLCQIYLKKQDFQKLSLLKNKIDVLRSKMPERVQIKVENYGTQIANKEGGFIINVSSLEEMQLLQQFLTENKFLTSDNNG